MEQAELPEHHGMETCSAPNNLDSPCANYRESLIDQYSWFAHIFLVLSVVLLARAFWFLDCPNRLLRIFRFLVTMARASGRANLRRRRQLVEEVKEMRTRLRGLSMTDNFAVYSKLERRIKAACGELEKTATDSLPNRIMLTGGFRLLCFLIELAIHYWLVRGSPSKLIPSAFFEFPDAPLPVPTDGLLSRFTTNVKQFLLLAVYWLPTQFYTIWLIFIGREFLALKLIRLVTKLGTIFSVSGASAAGSSDMFASD